MKRKRPQLFKQSVRRETPYTSKHIRSEEKASKPPKVNDGNHSLSEAVRSASGHTSTESQSTSSDPEREVSSKPTEHSRQIRRKNLEDVERTAGELLRMLRQLEVWCGGSDVSLSRKAFEALSATLQELLTWLWMMAIFPEASLGALLEHLPRDQALRKYKRGEHVAAWAGVELARLYKRIRAELASRSRHSVNRLRDLRSGVELGSFDFPPNRWFCAEYESKADYRPTGKMAVWIARKIQEVRLVKEAQSQWGLFQIVVQTANRTNAALPSWCRPPDVVKGVAALKALDELVPFGSINGKGFEAWRRFLRRQLLTQTDVIKEFRALFPQERRKLDGVLATTLRCAWRTPHAGGRVVFPILSGPCK